MKKEKKIKDRINKITIDFVNNGIIVRIDTKEYNPKEYVFKEWLDMIEFVDSYDIEYKEQLEE